MKSVYVSPKKLKEKYDDDLLVQDGYSVFQEVCKKLDIQIIRAYSPQAKGRVERKHKVFQDRFLKELKLYNIKTVDDANHHLKEKFIPAINRKFVVQPASDSDSHRDARLYGELNEILCWTYRRQLRNDWTIQFERQYFQLENTVPTLKPGEFITVRRYLDGEMRFWHDGQTIAYTKLSTKPEPPSRSKKYYTPKEPCDPVLRSKISRKNRNKSPWGQFNPDWLKRHSHLTKHTKLPEQE
jgi:hypothetical protein